MINIDTTEAKERLIAILELFPLWTAFIIFALFGTAGMLMVTAFERPKGVALADTSLDTYSMGILVLAAFIASAAWIVYRISTHRERR